MRKDGGDNQERFEVRLFDYDMSPEPVFHHELRSTVRFLMAGI